MTACLCHLCMQAAACAHLDILSNPDVSLRTDCAFAIPPQIRCDVSPNMTAYANISKRNFKHELNYKESVSVTCQPGYWPLDHGPCISTYTMLCNATRQIEDADFCVNTCQAPTGLGYFDPNAVQPNSGTGLSGMANMTNGTNASTINASMSHTNNTANESTSDNSTSNSSNVTEAPAPTPPPPRIYRYGYTP